MIIPISMLFFPIYIFSFPSTFFFIVSISILISIPFWSFWSFPFSFWLFPLIFHHFQFDRSNFHLIILISILIIPIPFQSDYPISFQINPISNVFLNAFLIPIFFHFLSSSASFLIAHHFINSSIHQFINSSIHQLINSSIHQFFSSFNP